MSGFMYNPKGNVWDKDLVPESPPTSYLDLSILEDIIRLFERIQTREIREQDSYNQNNTINIQIFIDNYNIFMQVIIHMINGACKFFDVEPTTFNLLKLDDYVFPYDDKLKQFEKQLKSNARAALNSVLFLFDPIEVGMIKLLK